MILAFSTMAPTPAKRKAKTLLKALGAHLSKWPDEEAVIVDSLAECFFNTCKTAPADERTGVTCRRAAQIFINKLKEDKQ